eukprot:m.150917 g.150917  ORF g.150917 m.150917 type:complete len:79 (+) comp17840_c0_seq1:929-1165(+)
MQKVRCVAKRLVLRAIECDTESHWWRIVRMAAGSKETAPLDGSVSGQSETPVDDIVAFGTESTWDTSGNPPRMTESSI